MITFQFDQCSNDKKLAQDCNNEGLCKAWRFPKRLVDALDPDVLPDLLGKSNPLFTTDHDIARKHTAFIPDHNPGMVILTNKESGDLRTMTTIIARQILRNFKKIFPQWHQAVLSNSIIEISAAHVEVCHVETGKLVRDEFILFADADWSVRLQDTLLRNMQRDPSL